jgi:flagellar assembly factor FliW
MELIGTRFGSFSYEEQDLLELPEGLLGMPELIRFLILDFEEGLPFKWLQSVDNPKIGFLIADPRLFRPDFALGLNSQDLGELEVRSVDELVVFVICALKGELESCTGNLLGPIIVHAESRRGRQLVLEDGSYSTHEPLYRGEAGAEPQEKSISVCEPQG